MTAEQPPATPPGRWSADLVPLEVRACRPADLAALDEHLPSGRNDVHAAFLARQEAGDATYLAAWRGAVPVGTGVVRWAGRSVEHPEISNLHVPVELRGRGIGTALVRAAEAVVAGRGHPAVAIGVDAGNPDAARLYDRLGYVDSGARWTADYTWYDEDGAERTETEHVRMLLRDLR